MEERNDVDVLVCGAGAAGLALAIDLARRGVSFRLIEKLDAPFAGSRGKGIQPRTQEVFDDLGLIDALAAVGRPYPPHRHHRDDGVVDEVQDIVMSAPTAQEPYRSMLLVPQFATEAVLRARLADFGAAPDYAHELLGFDQDVQGITARLATPTGETVVRCRYLVGADGGRSFVRRALALGFPGQTLGVRAIVTDITLDGLSRDAWHWFNQGDRTRQISFCPLPGGDLFQLQAPILDEGEPDLSVAGVQAFVDSRLASGIVAVTGVAWASAYVMSARLSDAYRVDRAFLIGDAAHIHPPTGAQGLNTSVQDAYNLGWKLAAVLNGAPATLLDTYEEERRPVAAGMLGLATDLLDKARAGNLRRGREVNQLDLDYGASSLSVPTAHAGPVVAGDRAPDAVLQGAGGQSRRLFDLFRGPHWTLIGYDLPAAALPAGRSGLHVHAVGAHAAYRDGDGAMAAAYGLAAGDLLLVRPDGYVAAVAARAEHAMALDEVYRIVRA